MTTGISIYLVGCIALSLNFALSSCALADERLDSLRFGKLTLKLKHLPTDGTGNATLEVTDGVSKKTMVIQAIAFNQLVSPDGSRLALPLRGGKLLIFGNATTVADIEQRKQQRSFTVYAHGATPYGEWYPIGSQFKKWKNPDIIVVGIAEPGPDRLIDVFIDLTSSSWTVDKKYLENVLQVRDFGKPIKVSTSTQSTKPAPQPPLKQRE